jgi:hypothetical protein
MAISKTVAWPPADNIGILNSVPLSIPCKLQHILNWHTNQLMIVWYLMGITVMMSYALGDFSWSWFIHSGHQGGLPWLRARMVSVGQTAHNAQAAKGLKLYTQPRLLFLSIHIDKECCLIAWSNYSSLKWGVEYHRHMFCLLTLQIMDYFAFSLQGRRITSCRLY